VPKAADARIVVIGPRMFTFRIDAGNEQARIDWRADFDALSYDLVATPVDVVVGVRAYIKALDLEFAALDFGIDAETGEWVFYESNAGGQYGWLEAQTGAPLTSALADLLAGAQR
jgi:hypothetical protein